MGSAFFASYIARTTRFPDPSACIVVNPENKSAIPESIYSLCLRKLIVFAEFPFFEVNRDFLVVM